MSENLKVFLNRFELFAEVSVSVIKAYENLDENEKSMVESCYLENIEELQEIVQTINYAYDHMEENTK